MLLRQKYFKGVATHTAVIVFTVDSRTSIYRENIFEVIESTGEKISALIVPKNSGLKGYAWKALSESGLGLESAAIVADGELNANGLRILLRRGEDIPQIVMQEFRRGNIVLGLTGDDLFDEYRLRDPKSTLKVENTYDWIDQDARFLRPALCLIGKRDPKELENINLAVNSKYQQTSLLYVEKTSWLKERNPKVTIYGGDLEKYVQGDLADLCIDTVYTGNSIDRMNLRVLQKIRFSDLVAISALSKEESLYGKVMAEELRRLVNRRSMPTSSYASGLLQNSERATRKLNEEAYEVVLAASNVTPGLIAELADLEFAKSIIMARAGITLDELAVEMIKRQK